MPLPLLAGLLLLTGSRNLDFYADGPYDSAAPKPESLLGYGPGERVTNFRDQERVVLAIAAKAGAKVRVIEYGRSVEGRPLRVFAVSSPRNIARLDQIRQDNEALAEPKPGQDTAAIQARTPALVWVNECIHGDEPASFESAMWLMYNLAAAKGGRIEKALDDAVVFLNPVYNPDGHERYAVYYDSVATGASEPGAFERQEPSLVYGRTNHYRFDMNRDRIAFSQDETRQEFAEFLRWHPQVYVDQHGQVGTYFFPPEPMSVNPNVDRVRNAKWTERFGRAVGQAFDQRGFSYFIKDEFDLYYPGYLDASTTLSGAIGMTHETDGSRYLAERRDDGSLNTLRHGIEKHFTSALAVIVAAAADRRELLADFADFKRKVASGEAAGKFRRVVVESADPRPLRRLRRQLAFAGVRSALTAEPLNQGDTHDYWSADHGRHTFAPGSLVIDMAQPQGALAKALLEPGQQFEPEFVQAQLAKRKAVPDDEKYPGPEDAEFYDLTGWALPYAHGLAARWCESAPPVRLAPDPTSEASVRPLPPSTVGYALPYEDEDDALAAADALAAGVHGRVSTKPMTLDGKTYARGTFLFLADRNDDDLAAKLAAVAAQRGVRFVPLTSSYPDADRTGPGSDSTLPLKKPKIGVVFGKGSDLADVGGVWYLLDRVFHLPFTPLSVNALQESLDGYTALVVPSDANVFITPKLREWVNGGGTLVVLGDLGWALGSGGFVDLEAGKGSPKSLPGALFRAELDPRNFLSYGYAAPAEGKIELAVPIADSTFYSLRREGGSVVTLSDRNDKLLTGWEWPDDTETALANTVWLQDAPAEHGHVVLFTQDPTARAMWPGLDKLLLNAILIGPGA